MKFKIGIVVFFIAIVIIVVNIASCGERKLRTELEVYIGQRLDDCYDDVIKIIEDAGYGYKLTDYYSDKTKYTTKETSDRDWLYEHEITSIGIASKYVDLNIGGYGLAGYFEVVRNSEN